MKRTSRKINVKAGGIPSPIKAEWDDIPRQEFLSYPNYPRGVFSLVDGATGSRKTWLHLYESKRLMEGKSVRGNPAIKKCRVMYLHNDMSSVDFRERMLRLGIVPTAQADLNEPMFLAFHIDMLNDHFSKHKLHGRYDQFYLDIGIHSSAKKDDRVRGIRYRNFLRKLVRDYRPDLLVIDPLFNFCLHDVTAFSSAKPVIEFFKDLAKTQKVHIRAIMNQGKPKTGGAKLGLLFGSSAFNNSVQVRETILLKEEEGAVWTYVHRTKDSLVQATKKNPLDFKFRLRHRMRDGEQVYQEAVFPSRKKGSDKKVRHRFPVRRVAYSYKFDWEAPRSAKASQVEEVIRSILKQHPKGLKTTELRSQVCAVTTCANATFNSYKKQLIARGVLRQEELGIKNVKMLFLVEG